MVPSQGLARLGKATLGYARLGKVIFNNGPLFVTGKKIFANAMFINNQWNVVGQQR